MDRKKYAGLGVPELRKLQWLEEENQKLKQWVAGLSQDEQVLYDVLKKALRPTQKRVMAASLIKDYRIATMRPCSVIYLQRSCWYYKPHRRDDSAICRQIKNLQVRICYRY